MIYPHTKEEQELIENGYKFIAGIDEAGRGALAGPVVAAAVVMPISHLHLTGVRDSKLLSPKKRDELYEKILENCLGFGIGIVENDIIDEINIYQASKLAMKKAVEALSKKPDYLLIDAMKLNVSTPQKSIIKGDMICYSIATASILAKVTRDRLMIEFHEKYPEYEFDKHKGYGTKIHNEALKKYGYCKIHRLSYKPILENSKFQKTNSK